MSDIDSPWTNLYYLSMAAMVIGWIVAGIATVMAAATIPYLAAMAMAALSRQPRRKTSGRTLITAAIIVIILMAAAVTGSAYGVGTLRNSEPENAAATRSGVPPHLTRRALNRDAIHDAGSACLHHQILPSPETQPLLNPRHPVAHRERTDLPHVANLLIAQPLSKLLQNLQLPVGQPLQTLDAAVSQRTTHRPSQPQHHVAQGITMPAPISTSPFLLAHTVGQQALHSSGS